MSLNFDVLKTGQGTEARRGRLQTTHGVIETPVFMPVGTLASVKSLIPRDLNEIGAPIMLSNAYHLMLRPGADLVAEMGGLHKFMGWNGSILTDSGGFQVFSLKGLRKVSEEGVEFRSHIDGSLWNLTPEELVRVQEKLGPDIAMVLDECPPGQADRETVARATDRTTRWAKRCSDSRTREDMAFFGIVQGGIFEDLRTAHVQQMTELPFEGFAVGGVSVGESPEDIARIVRHTAPLLPAEKPRYLMGVGTPADLVRGVDSGIDMFDCVMPTRNARNGQLFIWGGKITIKNAEHRHSDIPVDEHCDCHTCQNFSRAYLRHLFVGGELSYHRLATIHNLAYYVNLMQKMRDQLELGTFDAKGLLAEVG